MRRTLALLTLLALAGATPALAQVDPPRHLALGDSLTAGFASGGLVQYYQERSYPALLAQQAGVAAGFEMPLVSEPGLPPLLELVSLAGGVPVVVAPPVDPGAPLNATLQRPYNNLGVPGSNTFDLVNTTGDIQNLLAGNTDNVMHDLILRFPEAAGPSGPIPATALVQAIGLDPTFLTLWIGNNDLLGAAIYATPMDGVTMTPVGNFEQLYTTAVGTLVQMTDADIVLINLPDVTAIPFVTTVEPFVTIPGFGTVQLLGQFAEGVRPIPADHYLTLNASALIAQGYGIPGTGAPALPDDLTMQGNAIMPGVILRPDEVDAINSRVAAFNGVISAAASQFSLEVLDVNARFNEIAGGELWMLGGIAISADFLTGGIFSYDGVHPQNIGYALVAVDLIELLNEQMGADLPQVNMADILCSGGCGDGDVPLTGKADFSFETVQRLMDTFPLLGRPAHEHSAVD